MWQLFSIHDATFLFLSIKQLVGQVNIEQVTQQFLFLGIIPGTTYQLNFDTIKYGLMLIALLFVAVILYKKARSTINNIDPLRDFPPGFTKFDLIAL